MGHTYTRTSEVTEKRCKVGRSGPLLFVTVEHSYENGEGVVVAVEHENAVYRQGPEFPAVSRQEPATSPNADADAGKDNAAQSPFDSSAAGEHPARRPRIRGGHRY